jgi:DNA-3-methyladenine glycosylase I
MKDAGIVRNKMKIDGAVLSARAYLDIMEKGPGFANYLWDFVDGEPIDGKRRTIKQIPAASDVSVKLSKDLKARGFKFCGPTIVYAFMQAVGMVNDHLLTCHRHGAVGKAKRR